MALAKLLRSSFAFIPPSIFKRRNPPRRMRGLARRTTGKFRFPILFFLIIDAKRERSCAQTMSGGKYWNSSRFHLLFVWSGSVWKSVQPRLRNASTFARIESDKWAHTIRGRCGLREKLATSCHQYSSISRQLLGDALMWRDVRSKLWSCCFSCCARLPSLDTTCSCPTHVPLNSLKIPLSLKQLLFLRQVYCVFRW